MKDLRIRMTQLREHAEKRAPWDLILVEDFELHQAIAEYSRNRPSVAAMQAITRAMREAYTYISRELYDKVVSDVSGIVEAICDRQPELAEQRMKAHIAYFYEDMMSNRKAELTRSALVSGSTESSHTRRSAAAG